MASKGSSYKGSLFTTTVVKSPRPLEWIGPIEIAVEAGKIKIAGALRDKMRDAYDEMTHRTDYGQVSVVGDQSDPRSLANAIVVSQVGGVTTVGAKKATIGNISYADLFAIMDKGNRQAEGWWFKLHDYRGEAADNNDGFWFTKGQYSKPFITKTANEYAGLPLQKDTELYIGELIDTTFTKLGR